jgi:hypothetical protein
VLNSYAPAAAKEIRRQPSRARPRRPQAAFRIPRNRHRDFETVGWTAKASEVALARLPNTVSLADLSAGEIIPVADSVVVRDDPQHPRPSPS